MQAVQTLVELGQVLQFVMHGVQNKELLDFRYPDRH